MTNGPLLVAVAVGELADKITILEIKTERIADPAKLGNVRTELAMLREAWTRFGADAAGLSGLVQELKEINARLWEIEDRIRESEGRRDFGPAFVELARRVYRTNDRRAAIKRQINLAAGSAIIEEKSYADYGSDGAEGPSAAPSSRPGAGAS